MTSEERVEEFGGPTMGSTYSVKYVRSANGPDPDLLQGMANQRGGGSFHYF